MADHDEALNKLLDAIANLAAKAQNATANNSGAAEHFGSAARQLAEAYAWLTHPNQPH